MSRRGRRTAAASRPIELLLTRRAIADLRQLEAYSIETWGKRVARSYLDEIAAALDRIALQPDLLRAEPAFSQRLFFYRVRKHQLVCDVRQNRVTVLTVLHTSMDLPSRLAELEPRLSGEVRLLGQRLDQQID